MVRFISNINVSRDLCEIIYMQLYIMIVLRHTGYGSLSISTEGAYRMDLVCKNVTVNDLRGDYLLQYRPQEPGIYLLNIKYGDDQIAGSS